MLHPVFNPVAPYVYLFPKVYLFMADIVNPELFVCVCRTWICVHITCFYEEQRQLSSGSAWPAFPKTVNYVPIAGGGKFRHNLHSSDRSVVIDPPLVGCVVWSLHMVTTYIRHKHQQTKLPQNTTFIIATGCTTNTNIYTTKHTYYH